MLNVTIWQRDCDHVEWTRLEKVKNGRALMKLVRNIDRNAEGPYHLNILTDQEAAEFQAEEHDRVLEAFEDGHPHLVGTGRF